MYTIYRKLLPNQMKIYIFLILITFSFCEDFSHEVFGDSKVCCPAAFGHFNSDKLTDVFVIDKNPNEKSISILTSNTNPPLLKPSDVICKFNKKIISLVPADFDGDGAIDTLAILEDSNMYLGIMLWGNSSSWKCPGEKDFTIKFKSQPLLIDYNGDMIADLFGEDENSERVFWVFHSNRRIHPEVISMKANNTSPLSSAGGHSFVDVDGDLAADIWLVTKSSFELWKTSEDFEQFEKIDFPKGAETMGRSTFLDIDLDGKMEMLLPICKSSSSCFMYVYEFDTKKWHNLEMKFKDNEDNMWKFKVEPSFKYTDTITPRVGDYNFDGYPDILITMFDSNNKPRVIYLENAPCKGMCNYTRTFIPDWSKLSIFGESIMGTFFDFNEDGALDIFLVNVSSDGQSYGMGAFKNPLEFDATFLKVIVLTGKCYQNCSFDQKLHGTNQPGPSVIYTITTTEGILQKSCATQMSQSSHNSLQLPFITFGLGRSWNFVDKLTMGLPLQRHLATNSSTADIVTRKVLENSFLQIIPNSQLVIIPYPIWAPSKWVHKLFITPGKTMLLIAGALVATCLFVAGIVFLLHILERKEDKRERLQEAQRFHFVAM